MKSASSKHLSVEDARPRPQQHFASPAALIDDNSLRDQEKFEVLETRADQVGGRLSAGNEEMPTHRTGPRDEELLREIGLAREKPQGIDPNRRGTGFSDCS